MSPTGRAGVDRSARNAVNSRPSDSRLANDVARLIWSEYQDLWDQFHTITSRSPDRFATANWEGMELDTKARLKAYINKAALTADLARDACDDRLNSVALWTGIKAVFSGLIQDSAFQELAETFFNSITRKVFTTEGVNQQVEFVSSDFASLLPSEPEEGVLVSTNVENSISATLAGMLSAAMPTVLWEDLTSDCAKASVRLKEALGDVSSFETVQSVFYRGRGAYIIGRAWCDREQVPFALAFLHGPNGVRLDAVLTSESELSVLFSFAHSYFHAIIDHPSSLVGFLSSLMPRKRLGELYTSLGYHKHGKTDLFRSLVRHLERSPDRFTIAEGVEGMVMSVFTLPGFDVVFKVIKDSFPPQKKVTRTGVRSAYEVVFNHDRVGRLVDAYEFEHLTFARERFEPELLEHLARHCSRDVLIGAKEVLLNHVYIERKVTPLDVFLRRAHTEASVSAVVDYGQAIKDLMTAGIFPGDMLLKNFGVTRHGRIVFYDYDELQLIDQCKFREIPVAKHPDDEMSEDPWFSTGPGDVFPEEFIKFLGLQPALRQVFLDVHGDLFTCELWKSVQDSVASGDQMQIYPYNKYARVSTQ